MSRDLKSLRREAERLRLKAGAPIPRSTLDQLGAAALGILIRDARATIRAASEAAAHTVEWAEMVRQLDNDPEDERRRREALQPSGEVLSIDELLEEEPSKISN